MPNDPDTVAAVMARLLEHCNSRPHLAERIHRELMMELYRRGIATIDDIQDLARAQLGASPEEVPIDPNQPEHDRWDEKEREMIEKITREKVAKHFSLDDVDDLANLTLKREEVHSLENVAAQYNVTFRELAEKIQRYCQLPLGETKLAPAEVIATRVALTRHLISDQLEFIAIAKHHLTIRHFDDVSRRLLGSDSGMGRIGGKAGGMILANAILAEKEKPDEYLPLAVPDSYYLRSDVVEDFLRLNRLDEYQSQKYKPIDDVSREYPLIKGVFRNGEFPLKIVHDLRRILGEMGTHPLVVRSSSLLEDRLGTSFCGKYASVFVANQGSLEHRLRALLGAIAEVYASIMGPDPIFYRREHNLIDYVEEMAVLIQKAVGFQIGNYFLPAFAGVAFSRNEYRWSPRIKREDGLLRMVMGLGTRAVDRSGSDYPRMVAMGEPTLRPESSVEERLRCSQRTIDVIDLKRNRLRSIGLEELLKSGMNFPMLDRLVSVYKDRELYMPTSLLIDADASQLCITFDKLLRETPFVARVRSLLARLEPEYGGPVDMEFACDGEKFYIVQCRSLALSPERAPVQIPKNIPPENIVFDAHKYVKTGLIEGIEHIVYVPTELYDDIDTREQRTEVARVIGRINRTLPPKSFILIGPGRWGSVDILLGVPVRYADINRCRVLIEVSRIKDGFAPEVSFGTHFFQDLVEAGIDYIPLYPDEPGNQFNLALLMQSANQLAQIVPNDAEFEKVIRVIHVPTVAGGKTLTVAMDGDTDVAVAYLKK